MKTEQMNNERRRDWPSLALTAVALLGLIGLTYGQREPLSDLMPGKAQWELKEPPQVVIKVSPDRVPIKITDGGRQGDERSVTTQLIFAFDCDHIRTMTVDVFDEQGRTVGQHTLTSRPGKSALAMDVAGLRKGRYAARITEGEGSRLIRFNR